MALRFECTQCGEYIITKFLKVGESARCWNCGTDVVVPANASETNDEPKYTTSKATLDLEGRPILIGTKQFACKIPKAGPVIMSADIPEVAQLDLWQSQTKNATAKIHGNILSLIRDDKHGTSTNLMSIPLSKIERVIVRALDVGSQLGPAFHKSIFIGIPFGLTMFFVVKGLHKGMAWTVHPFLIGLLCLAAGMVISFLTSVIQIDPVTGTFTKRRILVEFVFKDCDNRVFTFAVEPEHRLGVQDAFTSAGLNIETKDIKKT